MNDTVWVALIVAIPPTITALAGIFVSLRNGRKVDDIKVATDGMKDALVKAAGQRGHAAGVKDEKAAAAKRKLK